MLQSGKISRPLYKTVSDVAMPIYFRRSSCLLCQRWRPTISSSLFWWQALLRFPQTCTTSPRDIPDTGQCSYRCHQIHLSTPTHSIPARDMNQHGNSSVCVWPRPVLQGMKVPLGSEVRAEDLLQFEQFSLLAWADSTLAPRSAVTSVIFAGQGSELPSLFSKCPRQSWLHLSFLCHNLKHILPPQRWSMDVWLY